MTDIALVNVSRRAELDDLMRYWQLLKSRTFQLLSGRSTQTTSAGSSYLVFLGDSRNTGSVLIRNVSLTAETALEVAPSVDDSPSTPSLVLTVKSRFGLNTTELAKVLRVGRPTVYSWLNDEVELHSSNLRRLGALAELAKSVSLPPALEAVVDGGSTLLDQLSAAELNLELLRSSLTSVMGRVLVKEGRLNSALRGYEPPAGARHRLDILTGRPLSDDE